MKSKYKRVLKLRYKYYKKILFNFFGYCPKCLSRVNYTRNGRAICPYCGR